MRKCSHCEKEIDKYPHVYIGVWENYRNNSVIYYHVDCFKEVAGEEYMSELLKADIVPESDDI